MNFDVCYFNKIAWHNIFIFLNTWVWLFNLTTNFKTHSLIKTSSWKVIKANANKIRSRTKLKNNRLSWFCVSSSLRIEETTRTGSNYYLIRCLEMFTIIKPFNLGESIVLQLAYHSRQKKNKTEKSFSL